MSKQIHQKVKTETVSKAIKDLSAVPEKPKDEITLRESIKQMQSAIAKTLKKGYDYDEVAKMLGDSGIQISGATLKQYLAKPRKPRVDQSPKAKEEANETETTAVKTSEEKLKKDEVKDKNLPVAADKKPLINAKTKDKAKTNEDDFPIY